MKIYFSRHAKRQMKWRKISEKEVEETLISPEKTEDSIKGRKNAFRHVGKKWLKVTFIQEIDQLVIITVIDKTRPEAR
jgi:hypothetical protein